MESRSKAKRVAVAIVIALGHIGAFFSICFIHCVLAVLRVGREATRTGMKMRTPGNDPQADIDQHQTIFSQHYREKNRKNDWFDMR